MTFDLWNILSALGRYSRVERLLYVKNIMQWFYYVLVQRRSLQGSLPVCVMCKKTIANRLGNCALDQRRRRY